MGKYLKLKDEKEGLELIYQFLKENNISATFSNVDEHGFTRTLSFFVNEQEYEVIWYVNESTLRIGSGPRSSFIKFRHVFIDKNFPIQGGNLSLGFAYSIKETQHIYDSKFPYDSFRIPLPLKQSQS